MSSATRRVLEFEAGGAGASAPDLAHFRGRYPLTVAGFGALPEREAWLRNIWRAETLWRESLETRAEAVTTGAPPRGLEAEGEFDVVCAGGRLGLLYAAALAARHGRRALVFDEAAVGAAGRDWDVSGEDLRGLVDSGLFTREEVEAAVAGRRRAGFVKFHDASSRVKAEPLWVEGVLDVSLDAGRLLALAAARLRERGGEALGYLRFVRVYVEPDRVSVETEDVRTGARRLFRAQLFLDATGAASPVARQLGGARALTHVSPAVGTVATGFARGGGPETVDFEVGEILVSTEDASDHRQLVWGGLPSAPARGEFTSYLFFYDALDSPADKSLLGLFERYFERLPAYKRRGAQWRVRRPVFGYAPGFRRYARRGRRETAAERVLIVGDGAARGGPLAFGGTGAHLRDLARTTHLVHLALAAGLTDARSLSEIGAEGLRPAPAADLAEFMRPTPQGSPSAVNETLNAVMAALHGLDERVRRELFLDRVSLTTLKKIFGQTARLYPRIFARVRDHLGARGTLWWVAGLAESALRERRGFRREPAHADEYAAADGDGPRLRAEAAREFARQLSLCKKGRGAGGPE